MISKARQLLEVAKAPFGIVQMKSSAEGEEYNLLKPFKTKADALAHFQSMKDRTGMMYIGKYYSETNHYHQIFKDQGDGKLVDSEEEMDKLIRYAGKQ